MRLVVPLALSAAAALFAGCNRDQPGTPKEEAVVIFRAADGRTLTMADLRGLTGTFQCEIPGRSNVSAMAESLHRKARQAGVAGDYKKEIALLERASSWLWLTVSGGKYSRPCFARTRSELKP